MPQPTDLVTDLPADFEVFGQAVATSMADLLGGTSGQVLAKNSNTDMDFVWVTSDDANAIQNSIVDAKGDLVAASANDTPARLAVGANGETLVADSSTSTGLRYTSLFGANKNKIINGDFYVNQRNLTSTTTSGFGFDRWNFLTANGTVTHSAQTFTPGTAPVAGYEGANFARIVTTGQTLASAYTIYRQNIEDVRTFAGQTATISFWAKANSGTPKIAFEFEQNFGTGGSPSSVVLTYGGQVTLSTSWARYSITASVPSISGKTIGTTANTSSFVVNLWVSAGTDFNARTGSIGIQSNTFDIWGVQVENGSVATAFQTATGTIQGELAACQRYYFRTQETSSSSSFLTTYGQATSSTEMRAVLVPPVSLRVNPTSIEYGNLRAYDGSGFITITSLVLGGTSKNNVDIVAGAASGFTTYRPTVIAVNGATQYIGLSAEL